jgi:hypothetical protein
MKIISLLNTIFIPVQRNGETYYMFLDSGCPFSFSKEIDEITSDDLELNFPFTLSLGDLEFSEVLQELSHLVGIEVAGILGLDFIMAFDNVLIDVRDETIEFNRSDFYADFELKCHFSQFIITSMAPIQEDYEALTVFDTGAFQCMSFKPIFSDYPTSFNWRFVSFMGTKSMNFSKDIELYLDGTFRGKHLFGETSDMPVIPFRYILGMNFASKYKVLIDVANSKLKFKDSLSTPLLNIEDSYSPGIQIKIIDNKIFVEHIRENCPNNLQVGDEIELSGIDMNSINKVNEIYNKLMYRPNNKPIMVKVNGFNQQLRMIDMFDK